VKMGQLVDSEEEIWQFWERGRDVSHRGSERERFPRRESQREDWGGSAKERK
jgi:hypothetical protein